MAFRRVFASAVFLIAASSAADALAEPTTAPLKVLEVRPYNVQGSPGAIYIRVDQASLCNTDTYKVDLSWSGSKEVLAVALAALVADKPVKVEIANNTPCAGFATLVQSLYIMKQ